MRNAIPQEKSDAENPHVRFDEGEGASAKPRRGSLLYKILVFFSLFVAVAPLGHCTTNMPPIVCITGQPGYEWPGRAEENELLIGTLKALGHKKAWYVRLPYATHGWAATCGDPYITLFALGRYLEGK